MSPIFLWLELENSSNFSMQEILSMSVDRSWEEKYFFHSLQGTVITRNDQVIP